MSTFVLNRSYGLQLPDSFVDVDREEMEYVDGGFYFGTYWWGIAGRLSSRDCNDIGAGLTIGAGAATIAAVCGGGVPAAIVAGILGIGVGIFWLAGNHDGIYCEYNYANGFKWNICW